MNLDCITETDLAAIVSHPGRLGTLGPRVKQMFVDYASHALRARRLRRAGRTVEALREESICDSIYDALPTGARW